MKRFLGKLGIFGFGGRLFVGWSEDGVWYGGGEYVML